MMGFIHPRIGIQARIDHDAINQVIDHHRDVIHASKPIVEGGFRLDLHRRPPLVEITGESGKREAGAVNGRPRRAFRGESGDDSATNSL
jgi:hypothetical protein